MFMMIFILLLVIFFSYLPSYSSKISRSIGGYFIHLTDEELNLRQQVRDLKAEQGAVSMTDEFAKYMKLQRKIDRLVDQVKKMGSSRSQKITMFSMGVKMVINVLHGIVMISVIIFYKNDPLYMLPEQWFYPVNRLIAFPTGVPGGIGVTCWILVCSSVVYRLKNFINVQPSAQELKVDS
ncbi:guided entry of tail-anchored proteins factor 1-like [Mercenaria mercenaria]|uniref:guided entry of tail-anchored proteins factor 1-like n=1 Tax=Mercenaria mercenaria TaxID=6596 RepID=UPI001E1DFCCA|nr:guided entry of tail-anchored proteins factor 1-like [Mercenaria mercenaria]XP_053397734.1 guided entry of tail-anchored proteins factor 1-like [Mercenaria mercenaria]